MQTDRPLPSNLDFERDVAGCLMNMEEEQERLAKCAITLTADDFTDIACKKTVKAVLQLLTQHKAVDTMSVFDLVQDPEVMELSAGIATTALLEDRIASLKNYASRRKAIVRAHEFITGIYTSDDPLSAIKAAGSDFTEYANYADMESGKVADAARIKSETIQDGISSGYVTHDYNDSGLKAGCLTFLTGYRGDGKTAVARQFGMASAMQKVPVFNFIGEASKETEKKNYAKLCAIPGELHVGENIGGRATYTVGDRAEERFNKQFEGLIHLCDTDIAKVQSKLFDVVMKHMESLATEKGVKIYILDNMTILNRKKGNDKFMEQERITEELKHFAKKYNVAVVILAHQAKGQTRVSGVSIQEDLADTVLRVVRFRDEDQKTKAKILAHVPFPEKVKKQITGMMLNEKVRDEGSQFATFTTWDGLRGACIEVSSLKKAAEYEANGFWVRHVHRMSEEDLPPKEKAAEARTAYKD